MNDFGCNFANIDRYTPERLKGIMEQSWNNGVDKIVCISNGISEAKRNIELAKQYKNLYFTLGTHPHNAKYFSVSDLEFFENNLTNEKCFGIGECGLDYNRMYSPKEKQIWTFECHLKLAKKTNSKLYLHCRDAFDDFIGILDKYQYYNGLVHCFTGDIIAALEFTKRGFKLGITGWLLDKRRNKNLVNAIQDERITIDMLVVETDAPFMPVKGKKESTPEDVYYVIEEIAKLKKIELSICGKTIYENSSEFLKKN